jgi:hypothetical protein
MSVEKITHLEKPSHNDGVVGSRLWKSSSNDLPRITTKWEQRQDFKSH